MGKPPFQKEELIGNYAIDSIFNIGGMGVIYLAKDHKVLIKTPFADSSPIFLEQFKEEIESLNKLDHPGIVKILDHGVKEGIPWYAMERLEGETLRDCLKKKGKLPVIEALRIFYPIIQSIAYAHLQARPVWHLDIKPENICLVERPVVVDFGLAQSRGDTSPIIPPHGTLLYMPPEQLLGRADSRTDVYALGVLLYEMLTGATPFARMSPEGDNTSLFDQILDLSLPAPCLTEVDPSISSVCAKALEKKADLRYADAAEMIPDLKFILRRQLKLEAMKMEENKNYQAAASLLREAVEFGLPIWELEEFWRFRIGKSLQVVLLDEQNLEAARRSLSLQKHPCLVPVLQVVEGELPYLIVESPTIDPLSKKISEGYYLNFRECVELCKALRISIESLKEINLGILLEERRIYPGRPFRIGGLQYARLGYQKIPARHIAQIVMQALSGRCGGHWEEFPDVFRLPLQNAFEGLSEGDAVELLKTIEDRWEEQEKGLQEIQRLKSRLVQMKGDQQIDKNLVKRLSSLSKHEGYEAIRSQAEQTLLELFKKPEDGDWDRFVRSLEDSETKPLPEVTPAHPSPITQKFTQFLNSLFHAEEGKEAALSEEEIDRAISQEEEKVYVNDFIAFFKTVMQEPSKLSQDELKGLLKRFVSHTQRESYQTRRIEKERVQLMRSLRQKEEILEEAERENETLKIKVSEQGRELEEKIRLLYEIKKKRESSVPEIEFPPEARAPVAKKVPLAFSEPFWEEIVRKGTWCTPAMVQMACFLKKEVEEKYARDLMENLYAVSPESEEIYEALVSFHWQREGWDELISIYLQKIQRLESQEAPSVLRIVQIYGNLAQVHSKKGEVENALRCCQRILTLSPHDLPSIKFLQGTYASQENYEKLRWAYRQEYECPETRLPRRIDLLLKIAEIEELRLERVEEARDAYRNVMEMEPDNLQAIRGLQRIYLQTENYPLLQEFFLKEAAIQKDRDRVVALYFEIAKCKQRHLEDEDGAIEYYQKVHLVHPRDLEVVRALKSLYRSKGNWAEYAGLMEKEISILQTSGEHHELHRELMKIYHESLGHFEKAILHGEAAFAAKPAPDILMELQSLYLKSQNKVSLAKTYMQEGRFLEPGERLVFVYLQAGKIYKEIGETELAIECFEKVIEYSPSHREALAYHVSLLTQSRQWEKLVRVYEQIVQLSKNQKEREDILVKMGSLLEKKIKDSGKALFAYRLACRLGPQNLLAVQGLRRILEREKRWVEAAEIMEIEAGLVHEKKRPALYLKIGEIWEEHLGSPFLAIEYYKKVMEYGFHAHTAGRLIQLCEKTGNFENMAVWLEKEIRLSPLKSPDLPAKLLKLAGVYRERLGKADQAVSLYLGLLKIDPKNIQAFDGLEELFRLQREWKSLANILKQRIFIVSNFQELFDLHVKIATVYARHLGMAEESIYHCEKALEILPNDIPTLHRLGKLYEELGLFSKRVALYAKELSLVEEPGRLQEIYLKMGEIWSLRLFDTHQAMYHFQKVWEMSRTVPIAHALISSYRTLRRWDDVAEILSWLIDQAVQREDLFGEIDLRIELGEIYRRMGKQPESIACFQQVLDSEPLHEKAFECLCGIYEERDDTHALLKLLEDRELLLSDAPPDEKLSLGRGKMYLKTGALEKAIASFLRVLEIDPSHEEALSSLHRIYDSLGQWEKMSEIVRKELQLASSPEKKAQLLCTLGNVHLSRIEEQKALSCFQEAIGHFPDHVPSLLKLFDLSAQNEQWEQAVEWASQALKHLKDLSAKVDLSLRMAEIYLCRLSMEEEACTRYEEVLRISPRELRSVEALLALYTRRERWEKVEELLAIKIDLLPRPLEGEPSDTLADCYYLWGEAARHRGKKEEALGRYRTSFRWASRIECLFALATLHEEREEWAESLEIFRKIQEIQGPSVGEETLYAIARLEEKTGHEEKAIAVYERMIQQGSSRRAPLYLSLSSLYRRSGNNAMALGNLERALQEKMSDEERGKAFYQKGTILERMEEKKKALECYAHAFAFSPQGAETAFALSRLYFEEKDSEKALEYQEKGISLLINADSLSKNLCIKGEILWKGMQRKEAAILAYRSVFAHDPMCLEALEKIAEIYKQEGEWDTLSRAYEEFLSRIPEEGMKPFFPLLLEQGYLLYEKLQDLPGALRVFKKALSLRPDHLESKIALAEIAVNLPGNEAESVAPLFVILEHDPFRIDSYEKLYTFLAGEKKSGGLRDALHLMLPEKYPIQEEEKKSPWRDSRQLHNLLVPKGLRPLLELCSLAGELFLKRTSFSRLKKRYGIAPRKHLKAQKSPWWEAISRMLHHFGLQKLRIYIVSDDRMRISIENTTPPSILISKKLMHQLFPEEFQWIIAKFLFYVLYGHILCHKLDGKGLSERISFLISEARQKGTGQKSKTRPDWGKRATDLYRAARVYQERLIGLTQKSGQALIRLDFKKTGEGLARLYRRKKEYGRAMAALGLRVGKRGMAFSSVSGAFLASRCERWKREWKRMKKRWDDRSSEQAVWGTQDVSFSPSFAEIVLRSQGGAILASEGFDDGYRAQEMDRHLERMAFLSNQFAFLVTQSLSLSLEMIYLMEQIEKGQFSRCPSPRPWEQLKQMPAIKSLMSFNVTMQRNEIQGGVL